MLCIPKHHSELSESFQVEYTRYAPVKNLLLQDTHFIDKRGRDAVKELTKEFSRPSQQHGVKTSSCLATQEDTQKQSGRNKLQ